MQTVVPSVPYDDIWMLYNRDGIGHRIVVSGQCERTTASIRLAHSYLEFDERQQTTVHRDSKTGRVFVLEVSVTDDRTVVCRYIYDVGDEVLDREKTFRDIESALRWLRNSSRKLICKFFDENVISGHDASFYISRLREFIDNTVYCMRARCGMLLSESEIADIRGRLRRMSNSWGKSGDKVSIPKMVDYLVVVHPELHVELGTISRTKDTKYAGSRLRIPGTRRYSGYHLDVWRASSNTRGRNGDLISHDTTETYRKNYEVARKIIEYEMNKGVPDCIHEWVSTGNIMSQESYVCQTCLARKFETPAEALHSDSKVST